MFLVIAQYLLLASTFTIGKAVIQYVSPIFFIGIRMILAGTLLLGYLFFFNKKSWKFRSRDIWIYVRLAFFHIYLSFVGEFWALQHTTSAKVSILYNLSPFITALLAYFLFGERLNLKKWGGLGIGILGFIPILYVHAPQEALAGQLWFISLPETVLFLAVISCCYAWLLIKELIVQKGYSILMLNGIAMISGGFLSLLTALAFEKAPFIQNTVDTQDVFGQYLAFIIGTQEIGFFLFLIYMSILILLTNVICFNVYGYLLRWYSATFLSFAGFTTPLFTAFWGWLLLSEKIGWEFYASLFITFWGLYLFYTQEKANTFSNKIDSH